MSSDKEEFLRRLMEAFRQEAAERMQSLSSGLLELEKAPPDKKSEIVEVIFREAHSLKGAARSVNLTAAEEIFHSLENVFAALKRNEIETPPEFFDAAHKIVDTTKDLLNTPAPDNRIVEAILQQITNLQAGKLARRVKPEAAPVFDKKNLMSQLAEIQQKRRKTGESKIPEKVAEEPVVQEPPAAPPPQTSVAPTVETLRISIAKLEALLRQAEEFISFKLTEHYRYAALMDLSDDIAALEKGLKKSCGAVKRTQKKETESPGTSAATATYDMVTEKLKSLKIKLSDLSKSVKNDLYQHSQMVDGLISEAQKVLMLPAATVLNIFPKMVRDLSRDKGKEIDITITGEDIEIDKRILEEIKNPLIHIVRNSIDHGIEKPDERMRKGKSQTGQINISVLQETGGKVEIVISDDGAGINIEKVKKAALKNGVITQKQAEELSAEEARMLIFKSSLSTSPIVTDVSGRGLGMSIVQESIQKLGGRLSLQSQPDKGTTFRFLLPVSMATSHGLLAETSGQKFVIPLLNVEKVDRIHKENIKTVENRETIEYFNQAVPLVHLSDVLELHRTAKKEDSKFIPVLVLALAEKRIAFCVDKVLYVQEALVKSLGRQLVRVRNIAGATILGSGELIPILNVADLMQSAINVSAQSIIGPAGEKKETEHKNILVVEDSFTSRTLLKNILETAGYIVKTAVDGIDGLGLLKTEEFDLVVSDVEMPRMDGFMLTSKIREDKKLAEKPVILVTARDSRQDRERGIDVGANAYIVKSSFDQSNLLDTVQRFI